MQNEKINEQIIRKKSVKNPNCVSSTAKPLGVIQKVEVLQPFKSFFQTHNHEKSVTIFGHFREQQFPFRDISEIRFNKMARNFLWKMFAW